MTSKPRRTLLLLSLGGILALISAMMICGHLSVRRLSAVDLTLLAPAAPAQDGPLIVGPPRPIDPSLHGAVNAVEWPLLTSDGRETGSISVFLFSSRQRQNQAYDLLSQMETQEGIETIDSEGIGERSITGTTDYIGFITFARCEAIATISIQAHDATTESLRQASALARGIDRQLKEQVCE